MVYNHPQTLIPILNKIRDISKLLDGVRHIVTVKIFQKDEENTIKSNNLYICDNTFII